MDARTKWIKKWVEKHGEDYRLRDQAIANVRERQERALEQFRASIDQDELEVTEMDRLANLKGAKAYARTQARHKRK